ncbi:DUF192 domain-containing protein [Castellaniella sp.]|uniref:DUF192 domain-containing protein n=1 Tax=Castellaniella sp. TaxID=1955812 RepID=UPI002AFF670D|nr:DUF192 domain-containing protein [Castellaniella sp.]
MRWPCRLQLPGGGPRDSPLWCAQPHVLRLYQALGFRQRLLGLHAWQSWGDQPRGLVFSGCQMVHAGWLAQPLDVVFISRQGVLLRVVHQLAPNRLAACRGADAVIELPPGYCRQSGWQVRVQSAWASLKMVA